jgi:hypothetical protein
MEHTKHCNGLEEYDKAVRGTVHHGRPANETDCNCSCHGVEQP